MTCMTTKKKFDVTDPTVVVLKNGRYAYREMCPWKGKHDRDLYAFKFCSKTAHEQYTAKQTPAEAPEKEEGEISE